METSELQVNFHWVIDQTPFFVFIFSLKWYCDENHIFPIEPILKHEQVACVTRKMLFTIYFQISLLVPEIFKFLKYAN